MTTTYSDLRQRMIDGDDTITAAQLDKARREAEFEQVQAEARAAAEARTTEEQRQAQIETLRRRSSAAESSGAEELQAAYRAALEALRALRRGMTEHNREAQSIAAQAGRLEATGVQAPRMFNIEVELDRLFARGRTDGPHAAPFSALVDATYRAEASEWAAEQQRRLADREQARRAEAAAAEASREEEQRRIDERRYLLGWLA